MKGFKGFDKDLNCRGMQYEIGKTYTHDGTVSLCNKGFHFVEHPFDAFSYYAPGKSRYAEVEANDVSEEKGNDSKRVAKSIRVAVELKIPALIKAAVAFVFEKSKPTTGNYAHSATTGDYAHSATTGDSAHSATTGYYAHSATTGDSAHSATTGDYAHSATTGYYAHSATTGDSAHSATTGDYAHSATTGYSAKASAMGKESIAAALGYQGQAKGPLNGWLVLAEIDGNLKIRAVGVARVDGKKIKADTYYTLKGGKFTEAA
jgi:hypothetical protein